MLIHGMSLCDVYVNNNDDDDESQTDKKNVEEKKNLCKLWEVVCGASYSKLNWFKWQHHHYVWIILWEIGEVVGYKVRHDLRFCGWRKC